MGRTRALLLALAVALVVAACGPAATDGPAVVEGSLLPSTAPTEAAGDATTAPAPSGQPTTTDGTAAPTSGDGGQQPDQQADQTGGGTDGTSGSSGGGDSGQQPQLTALVDDGQVGANAAAYLRGDRPRAVLEVDVQDGANLPAGVLDHVRSILDRESASTVELRTGTADVGRRDAWSADQLRAAADQLRDTAHADDTAVVHLLVLRDGFAQDGVLGVAFDATSAAVFPDQWSDLATALLSGDRIARAVTTHEVGHLLGLVGLYEAPTSDHEDPEHPGHTSDAQDVMYYAVESSLISQLDGIPTDFGPATRADLAAIRAG